MAYGGPGARIGGHPIHPMLVPFPIAFLVGAFACDLRILGHAHAAPGHGRAVVDRRGPRQAALAALAGLHDFLTQQPIRTIPDAWRHLFGNVLPWRSRS